MSNQDQVRDFREKPFSWQDKESLRKMRDHLSGSDLVKARSLYLALSEIASDNSTDEFKPSGGNKTIQTYSGLTDSALRKARENLIKLGLIRVFELYKEGGGKVGYYYQILSPDRDGELKEPEIKQLTIENEHKPEIKGYGSKGMESKSKDQGGPLEVKEKENKEDLEGKDNNVSDKSEDDSPEYDKNSPSYKATVYLIERIREYNPKTPVPKPDDITRDRMQRWCRAMDRLNRIGPKGGDDGYSWNKIRDIIDWVFYEDDFWPQQIQSATGLRDKIVKIENQYKSARNNGKDLNGKSEGDYLRELAREGS